MLVRFSFVDPPPLTRTRRRIIATRTGTKDLQTVQISLRVLSRPDVAHLAAIYKDLGEDFDERVLPSIVSEVLKATVAQFDADQLLTQRESVSRSIRESLNARAAEFHLYLEDVSITHLMFSKEFTIAIESKQVAQQDAERSKFVVLKAEQERQAAIIRAEGESEAARARELLYLSEKFDAAQALDWGLVTRVFEPEALFDATLEAARTMASFAPQPLMAMKANILSAEDLALRPYIEVETARHLHLASGSSLKEGFAAFRAKQADT